MSGVCCEWSFYPSTPASMPIGGYQHVDRVLDNCRMRQISRNGRVHDLFQDGPFRHAVEDLSRAALASWSVAEVILV
jgi:hypothetical protein